MMFKWLVSVFLLGLTISASALETIPAPESGVLIAQSQSANTQHRLLLSKVRRISGQLVVDRELQLSGALSLRTYELEAGVSALGQFAQLIDKMRADKASLLFLCQGRDCGSSSLWANAVFNHSRLYGLDDQQAYAVLQRGDSLLGIYSVVRGNRRGYMHLEWLVSDQPLGELLPEAATLTYLLKKSEPLVLALEGEPELPWVEALAGALRREATLRVEVGGPFAQLWRDALVAQGVLAARLQLADRPSPTLFLQSLR